MGQSWRVQGERVKVKKEEIFSPPLSPFAFSLLQIPLPNLKYAIPTFWKNEFAPLGAFLGDNALLGF
jgi:hypothetical protein